MLIIVTSMSQYYRVVIWYSAIVLILCNCVIYVNEPSVSIKIGFNFIFGRSLFMFTRIAVCCLTTMILGGLGCVVMIDSMLINFDDFGSVQNVNSGIFHSSSMTTALETVIDSRNAGLPW